MSALSDAITDQVQSVAHALTHRPVSAIPKCPTAPLE
jgi:hypothetical protein